MSRHIKWFYIGLKVICIGILWLGLPDFGPEISLKIRLSDNMTHGTMISVLVFLVGDVFALAALFSDRIGRWTKVARIVVAPRFVSWFLLMTSYEISQSEWIISWHPENYVLGIGVLQFVVIDAIVFVVVFWTKQPDDGKVVHELEQEKDHA